MTYYEDMEQVFRDLTDEWQLETGHHSNTSFKFLHPSYQQIIGMGPVALPMILEELRDNSGHWFWALKMISREDPTHEGQDWKEAVDAWLEWGKEKGYLSDKGDVSND